MMVKSFSGARYFVIVILFDLLPCSLWRITMSSRSVGDISLIWIGHIASLIYDLLFFHNFEAWLCMWQVTTSINNLILGKLYVDHYGTMRIQGNRELSCRLKFKEQSIVDRTPHQVLKTKELISALPPC
jgi:hypothetical protein